MTAHGRWHEVLRDAISEGAQAVLVTVAAEIGSTPREAGAAMVVTAERTSGTIGGGHLEYEATRLAREALESHASPAQWLVRFPLAARLGQCCGGVATLSFATLDEEALSWLDVAAACARAGTPFVVAGKIGADDHAGRRLIVTSDDARGTLGDDAIDSATILEARARLALQVAQARSGTALVALFGVTLLLHVCRPERFAVCVFGNGHVGRALVQVLSALPADVRWIDTREHDFPPQLPGNVETVITDDPAAEIASAPRGAYVAVMTHSHPLDFDIVEAALVRDDWSYLGLIGSKAKRAQFERRLIARGTAPDALFRLTCPIGAGALRSKEPGVIAVATAAEMLARRESFVVPVEAGTQRLRKEESLDSRVRGNDDGKSGSITPFGRR
jgi:xanthine dehydrogenase accessory factor